MAFALIAVGDELLTGFTPDTNSHWLAGRLRELGFALKRITVVGDQPADVAGQLRRDLHDPAVQDVLCSGGLGPTHDDRTAEAVAAALGRDLVDWPPVRERIERRLAQLRAAGLLAAGEDTGPSRRMARIPARPDHVFQNRRGMAPGLVYEVGGRRLFVLPGVPRELKTIFAEELEPRYLAGRRAAAVRELHFAFAMESRFAPFLAALQSSHPGVAIGSYPSAETGRLVLRFSGPAGAAVQEVAELASRRAAELGMKPVG